MVNYAQIDNSNICIGLSQLAGEVISENLVKIDVYDTDFLGKKYKDGEFIIREEPDELEPIDLTETQVIMLALAEIYEKLEGAE